MNNRLRSSITLHNELHGFRHGRRTGTETLELKLTQQLKGLYNEPLLFVLLDMRKTYDSLDRGSFMEILREYGIRTKLQRLLQQFWDEQAVVMKEGKFYGRPFRTEGGVTQGEPVSSTVFNNVVEAVVRAVLLEVCGLHEEQHGLGWAAGDHNRVFYAEDRRTAGRKQIWIQTTLMAVVRIV